jgi:hypothetical protein
VEITPQPSFDSRSRSTERVAGPRWDDPASLALAAEHHARWHRLACDQSVPREKLLAARHQWYATQRDIIKQFVAERGWRLSKPFSVAQLNRQRTKYARLNGFWSAASFEPSPDTVDHPTFFSAHGPVAAVMHTYATSFTPAYEFAARRQLIVEPLPWSWYYPRKCIAFAYLQGTQP